MEQNKIPTAAGGHSQSEEAFDHLEHVDIKTKTDRVINGVGGLVAWIIGVSLVIMIYEVFRRYVLNSPTKWVHETTIMLVAVTFAFGGVIALARGKHIRVNMLYSKFGPKGQRVINIGVSIITALYCLALAYATFISFKSSIFAPDGTLYFERSGSAWNPPFPPIVKGAVLLAVFIMFIQSVLHIAYFIKNKHTS